MELIATEIICLAVIAATVAAMVSNTRNRDGDNTALLFSYIAFIVYLVFSIIIHMQTEGLFIHPPLVLKSALFIHMVSVPLFILIWLSGMEGRLLRSRQSRMVITVQALIVASFVVVTVADIFWGRLFVFDRAGMLAGGTGMGIMLAISMLITLIALFILITFRRLFTYLNFTALLLATLLLFISLIFFALFRRPYLFGIVSTFTLLFSYLAWQRREFTLDSLTKIPNYTAYLNHLRQITAQGREKTIIMIDIENFRLINDRYSNEIGDRTLAAFAAAISTLSPRMDTYRLFANRFALIGPRLTHPELVRAVDRLRTIGVVGWLIDGQHITIHLQFAIVETPLGSNTVAEITESIEFTMAEIKEQRRLSVIIFNQRLVPVRKRRLEILSTLRSAIVDESMVVVHYQPIIDAHDNRIIALEALMRLCDPHLGEISPAEFIPAAEQTGLIRELTTIMVRKVCTLLAQHRHLADNLSHISVNISAADLCSPEMGSRLLPLLSESGIDPSKLVFEVTESMLLVASEQVKRNWSLFVENGVHFILDDFGTGYSSIESLVTLPFEIVKLDRSVISNDVNDYQLIALISSMLKQLGKQMIAEGVETGEQLTVANAHGVDYIQGYYFSKPVGEAQVIEWMGHSMCIVPPNR